MSPLALVDGWVNPTLLAGVALAAVPLAIHLLNRQRHRPLAWGAMRFVLAAYKRTRRRARLEELLLLLLRMAAVALLALAVARPFAGAASPLAALTESRRDVVLVLDGSASTGYRETVETTFESIVARARMLLADLDAGRGDRVRLVLAARDPRLLSWRTPDEALSVLGTLAEPTDEELDLERCFHEIARFAEEDADGAAEGALEVRLLSDLQRRAFDPSVDAAARSAEAGEAPPGPAAPAASFLEPLDRLRELGVQVWVEDHGPSEPTPANLGILEVEPLTQPSGPGAPFEVAVQVANWGSAARAGVRVALALDGERRPVQTLDVPARGSARATFQVSFASSGAHTLAAEIDADRLEIDDRRTSVVVVPPPVRTLLVNGAPAARIDEDEIGLLAAVLAPPEDDAIGLAGGSHPFALRAVEPDDLRDEGAVELASFDAIVLANVASLPARVVERLEERVAEGAALVFAVGDRVDAERWNQSFWRADGSGLLPAELGARMEVRERRSGYWRVSDFDAAHPALAFFGDERWRPFLTEVPIYAFLAARAQPNARVLASLDDEGGHALLVEKAYDRGRVFLWTTTLDPAWTMLPELPQSLVPLAHELLRYAATPPHAPRNLAVGAPLVPEFEAFPQGATVLRPDGARRPMDGEPEALGSRLWRLPAFMGTDRAGLYLVQAEGAPALSYAVQIEPAEGDLERIGAGELEALHPALALAQGASADESEEQAPVQGELWRGLALAALAALVGESLWAAFLGHKRSRTA